MFSISTPYFGEMPALGPQSRPEVFAQLDGRTKAARIVGRAKRDLTEQYQPRTASDRLLIDRAATFVLQIQLIEVAAARSGVGMTQHDIESYSALTGHLSRIFSKLGQTPPVAVVPSLAEFLAARASGADP